MKQNLRNSLSLFIKQSDLFELAEAQQIINDILMENDFPTKQYLKWLKDKKS